ncbi:MAG: PEGA domain-containing protein [Methanomicrobiales archaeon]|nr:PEGA domain-containing protein [Methanomicrobiales archaeon]
MMITNSHLAFGICILLSILLTIPVSGNETENDTIFINHEEIFPMEDYSPEPESEKPDELTFISELPTVEGVGGKSGWFRIMSDPNAAQVTFDGVSIGITPVITRVSSTGTPFHTVEIELENYKKWTQVFYENPTPGQTIRVFAKLVPDECCADLRITSAPSGAQLLINGRFIGNTPKTIKNLMPGLYQVTLSRSGYETWHKSIWVSPKKENSYYVILEPMFAPITSGTLLVKSYPEGAEITLDKTVRGKTPRTLTLPEGPHTITLTLDGYLPYSTTMFIRDKEDARIDVTLTPGGNIDTPLIIASKDRETIVDISSLEEMGDMAAGFMQRSGTEKFLTEVNKPGGQFQQNGRFITVIDEEGTVMAHPGAPSVVHANLTSITDRNMIPYGEIQISVSQSGGGTIYESDITNNTPDGGIIISSVRSVLENLIITTSYPLEIPLPAITPSEFSLLSDKDLLYEEEFRQIREITLSVNETSEDGTGEFSEIIAALNHADENGIVQMPVLQVLARNGGGFCYMTDPEYPAFLTLAYVTGIHENKAQLRWISTSEPDKKAPEKIES